MSLNSDSPRAITEFETANGPADYALWADGVIVGIVDAKKLSLGPQSVQSLRRSRRPRSARQTRVNSRKYLIPTFGDIPLRDKNALMLQKYFPGLGASALSGDTVLKIKEVLSSVLS